MEFDYSSFVSSELGRSSGYVIIGRPNCVWCERAKELLATKNRPFKYLNIREDTRAMDFLSYNGMSSVPQIFYNGHHIGGFEDLKEFTE